MIFNRQWYELHEGRAEFDEYRSRFNRLTPSERIELLQFLSGRNPAAYNSDMRDLPSNLQDVAKFYVPISKSREAEIWKQRSRANANKTADVRLTSEEIVEDAGLNDDVVEPAQHKRKRSTEASQWA